MFQATHPDRLYWPKEKISKGDLLKYYEKIAPLILPYLKDRPLAMHRFPNGIQESSFFQKDVQEVPPFVKTAVVAHKEKKVRYILVQNLDTLLYVANLGSIELHTFHSRVGSLDNPDYALLDLDPEGVPFRAVVEVALQAHELLGKAPHFCKTSGGTGLHILVPLGGKYSYSMAKKLMVALAKAVHAKLPKLTSMERSPAKRWSKVYLDVQQNNRGQLMAAPYTARAFAGAPVSTPLAWSEVKVGLDPKEFTIENVPARVGRKKDLLKGLLGKGVDLRKILSCLTLAD